MRKRERENPCGVCGHYHKYEEGEVCGVCGHRMPAVAERTSIQTVPACQNLYKNSFTYHYLQDDKILQFEDANQFLEQCERDKARVLVHCMSGKNRSPAIVIAYLMKSRGWRLAPSYQWVKERRPAVELSEANYHQLQEYEEKIFGSTDSSNPTLPAFPPAAPSFSFGFPRANDPVPLPAFNNDGATSIFARPPIDIPPQDFTFGASQPQNVISGSAFRANLQNSNPSDIPMDSS